MVDLRSLVEQTRRSPDGEGYLPLAKGPGYRTGVGARLTAGGEAVLFIEAVLDLFPNRPRVDAGRLADRAELLVRLRERGYAITTDDDSTILCEREVAPRSVGREARELERLLAAARSRRRTNLHVPRRD